jgi:flagellar basal body-associated protein FliL
VLQMSAANDMRALDAQTVEEDPVPNLIWIIIVVLVVLALLGYFGRGRFRG